MRQRLGWPLAVCQINDNNHHFPSQNDNYIASRKIQQDGIKTWWCQQNFPSILPTTMQQTKPSISCWGDLKNIYICCCVDIWCCARMHNWRWRARAPCPSYDTVGKWQLIIKKIWQLGEMRSRARSSVVKMFDKRVYKIGREVNGCTFQYCIFVSYSFLTHSARGNILHTFTIEYIYNISEAFCMKLCKSGDSSVLIINEWCQFYAWH